MYSRDLYINEPIFLEKELTTLFNVDAKLIIFEIGACEGEDSIKYARLFKNSQIFSFEPFPKNIELFKKNLEKYFVKNVTISSKALSVADGTSEFYTSEGQPENIIESDWDYGNKSSSLLAPDKHTEAVPFIKFNKKITVETTTIATFCKANNLPEIDYIHMDVQGAELMVLQGAGEFIKFIKVIWLEVSKISFYKDQPLVNDINTFLTLNNFILAKDCLNGTQGDQLYISKFFYPDYQKIVKSFNKKENSLIKKILKKLT